MHTRTQEVVENKGFVPGGTRRIPPKYDKICTNPAFSALCGSGQQDVRITILRDTRADRIVEVLVRRSERAKAIDVAVEHAESGGDQDCVVYLDVGRALGFGAGDIVGGHFFPAFLDVPGNGEKRLQFRADRRFEVVRTDCVDQFVTLVKLVSRNGDDWFGRRSSRYAKKRMSR